MLKKMRVDSIERRRRRQVYNEICALNACRRQCRHISLTVGDKESSACQDHDGDCWFHFLEKKKTASSPKIQICPVRENGSYGDEFNDDVVILSDDAILMFVLTRHIRFDFDLGH